MHAPYRLDLSRCNKHLEFTSPAHLGIPKVYCSYEVAKTHYTVQLVITVVNSIYT